jgi:hypothetical protein
MDAKGTLGKAPIESETGGAGELEIPLRSVVEINRKRIFNLQEAQELLPLISKITLVYFKQVEALMQKLQNLPSGSVAAGSTSAYSSGLEIQIDTLILEWQTKLQKLGLVTKGLWLADFDAGDGYYCWKFPEIKIQFWHHYQDGFTRRVLLGDVTTKNQAIL